MFLKLLSMNGVTVNIIKTEVEKPLKKMFQQLILLNILDITSFIYTLPLLCFND